MPYTYNPFTRTLDYYEPGTASSGESNTGSNIGSGEGVFASKLGVELRFKSLDAGSSALTLASTADTITIDVDQSAIDHTSLLNVGTNTHVQIDSHISDADKHREINDLGTSTTDLWSASKIDTELTGHTHFDNPRVVFQEQFTGTGAQVAFTLTGSILNGSFSSGSWAIGNVMTTYPADVTSTSNGALYDSANIFTRNRISVSSINGSGDVTLSHAPRSGEDFYVWYWYEIQDADIVDDYYREDFVSSMEAASQTIASAVPVDTATFSNILGAGDSNVQAALNTLDDHVHDYSEITNPPGDDDFHTLTLSGSSEDTDEFLIWDDSESAYRRITKAVCIGSISHNNLQDIGSNTHIQIDTHIADTSIHFAKSSISLGDLSDTTITTEADGDLLHYNGSAWVNGVPSFMRDSTEPTGFVNRTDSVISFDDVTRTLTIQPSGVSYDYYYQGEKFRKTSSDSVVISDTTGTHYVYFENDVLTTTTTYSFDIIVSKVKVSIIYWDSAASKAIYVGDERHGMTMDGFTHLYVHEAFGALWAFGLTPSGLTIGDGSLDAHAQVAIDYGAFADDDILHLVFPKSAPAGLPVYYLSSTGTWNQDTATNFPAKSFSGGSGRLAYNSESGGTWSQTEVPDGKYVISHVVANNDYRTGYANSVVVQGWTYYDTLLEATAGALEEINDIINQTLPFQEWVPIAGLIFQTDNTYTNSVKARLVQTYWTSDDYVDYTKIKYASTGTPIKHSLLDGIQHDDHLQYFNIDGRVSGQTAYGGYNSGADLTLVSNTSNDGSILLGEGASYFDITTTALAAAGTGSNIDISITPKGTAGVVLPDLGSAPADTTQKLYSLNGVLFFDGVSLEASGGSLAMNDLTDVNTAGVQNDDVLAWDSYLNLWTPAVFSLDLDDLGDVDATSPDDGNGIYYNSVSGDWEAGQNPVHADSKEPTGFPFSQLAASSISFDDGTRTFTIQPSGGSGSEFYFYQLGEKYSVGAPDTVVISDTEGTHAIYYDSGVLTALANPTSQQSGDLIRSKALVSYLYWDATNSQQIYFANERHGIQMDGMTHTWLHFTVGTVLIQGGTLNTIDTDQDGSLDAHAQFGINTTGIVDEDLTHFSSPIASTTGVPIYYKDGSSGNWRRQLNSGFSVLTTGTGRLAWNENTGSTWQLTEATNNDFVLCHIFATNDETYKIISIMGQAEYANLGAARVGASTELNSLITTGIGFQEFVPLATVIFQTSNGYANAVQARTRTTDTGDEYVSWVDAQFSPASGSITSHSDLANLDSPDHPATAVRFEQGGLEDTANIYDLHDFINNIWSATSISGFALTENVDGTVDVAAGEVVLRNSTGANDPLHAFPIDATASSLTLTDNDTNYVCVEYNSGSPQFSVTTSLGSSGRDKVCLYAVTRVGTSLYSLDLRQTAVDGINRVVIKDIATNGYEHVLGGTVIGETGTRNITLTSGAFYYGVTRLAHSAFDTSGADTFTYCYQDGLGGWTRVTSQTQIDNQNYDDGSGTLAALPNNYFGNHWIYLVPNTPDQLFVVYGQDQYANLAAAEAAGEPSTLPPEVASGSTGILVGKIIIEEDGTSFDAVLSPFTDPLGTTTASDHNNLAGLQGGTVGEYYHFTSAQHTDLTDAGDSTLHYHVTDRARANHTGTQTASTISDFDTEVSNNTDVAANTAARHDAVTLAASATTGGLSLSTQEIGFQAATSLQNGYLTSTDWSTFNGKQDALSISDLTETTSSVLTIVGGTGAVIGSGTTIEVDQADAANDGYLSSTDWNTFNNKSDYSDPLTTRGDLVYRNAVATTRLPLGTSGQVLYSDGTNGLWQTLAASDISDFDTEVSNNTDVAANTAARHNAVTLAASATTGGLSLSTQELGFQAATTSANGYLTSTDWNTFDGKEDVLTFQQSITRSGDTINLVNDETSPGNYKYYGTDSSGTRGFHDLGSQTYENTDVDTGTETVDSFADTLAKAVHWDYVVYKGANLRTGIVMAVWNEGTDAIDYNEVGTVDVGDTSDLTLSVNIDTNTVRLSATAASDNWGVKVSRRIL